MRNTKEKGIVHFSIIKWGGNYIGICKELGLVEQDENFEVVTKKLVNGAEAVVLGVRESNQNLEDGLNTSPPFRYLLLYYLAPLIPLLEDITFSKNIVNLRERHA